MSGPWMSQKVAETMDFTALPPAANNSGRVIRCNPLVAGQGYFYMVSDGTFWRPYGGEQKGYALAAPIDMAENSLAQKLLFIPIPPLFIPCGRTCIKTVIGVDKLPTNLTADTVNFFQRFGPSNNATDPIIFQSTLTPTSISGGMTNEGNRLSATTFRKHGGAGAASATALSSTSATARAAAITVGNLDSVTNYLSVWGLMTTGVSEIGSLHSFTMEIIG